MKNVTLAGPSVAVKDVGLITHDVQLILFDAEKHKPRMGEAVWVLMRYEDNETCWEHAEWQDGSGVVEAGWYFMGLGEPINCPDYRVLMWSYEPSVPDLRALGWPA